MASAVERAYNGGLGATPSGVQGLCLWSGGQGALPLEADEIYANKTHIFQ